MDRRSRPRQRSQTQMPLGNGQTSEWSNFSINRTQLLLHSGELFSEILGFLQESRYLDFYLKLLLLWNVGFFFFRKWTQPNKINKYLSFQGLQFWSLIWAESYFPVATNFRREVLEIDTDELEIDGILVRRVWTGKPRMLAPKLEGRKGTLEDISDLKYTLAFFFITNLPL